MLGKNKIKFVTSLIKKKHRNETGLFVAEGTKLVDEIISSGFQVMLLCGTTEWMNSSTYTNEPNIQERITITRKELNKISSQKSPNQVLAVVRQPAHDIDESELSNDLSLVLDRISDPGNLGTIIRIADWFGIKNVICSPDTVDVYNPKVVQSTMGSICRVKLHYLDLAGFLPKYRDKQNFGIYGSFLDGENIYHADLTNNGIIVMGSESQGISRELKPLITNRISIPRFSTNPVHRADSLNVAVSAGIVCAEFRRMKSKSKVIRNENSV